MSKKISPKDSPNPSKGKKGRITDTSWGGVASWYDAHLEKGNDTYHERVVYPHLLRILGTLKEKRVLDLACGQGQFSHILAQEGAHVTGVDLGKALIALAEKGNKDLKQGARAVSYFHAHADDLYMLPNASCDKVVCILALQNIETLEKTIAEVARVLVPSGTFTFVLNHPSFRNPRHTRWGFDEQEHVQYRRIDEYMSESRVKIDMTPGSKASKQFTVSFHRPLQVYVKALAKHGLFVCRLEEWVSHKESEQGTRQKAENKSRKEIPLFMCLEAEKIK